MSVERSAGRERHNAGDRAGDTKRRPRRGELRARSRWHHWYAIGGQARYWC